MDKTKDGNAHLEDVTSAEHKDVVPDTNAETERETVEKKGLEPFLKPKKVGNTDVLEVFVELG